MAKKHVFFSFDFDNDQDLKILMVGQGKLPDSPFDFADYSLKEAAPQAEWEKKAKAAIKRSDIVVVLVGAKTHSASGVLKEVGFARDAEVKIVQIIGHKDASPTRVPDAGTLYAWGWENLKKLLG